MMSKGGLGKKRPGVLFLAAILAACLLLGLFLYHPVVVSSSYVMHVAPGESAAVALFDTAAPVSPQPSQDYDLVVPEWPETTNVSMPAVAAQVLAAERAGKGRKVISMALYGDKPRYTAGAIDNAVIARRDWEGWTFRIVDAEGVPGEVLTILAALGTELLRVDGNQRGSAGMFWRFYALEDRTASRIIIRDTDSRLTHRDKMAVDEWVASGYYFHTMNDNPAHGLAILGGMWGAVNGLIHPRVIAAWRDQDAKSQTAYPWGTDQGWLQSTLWPGVKPYALQHASFMCGAFGAAAWKPFPTKRDSERDFVGIVYAPDNFYMGLPLITADCPEKCRKEPSWTKC